MPGAQHHRPAHCLAKHCECTGWKDEQLTDLDEVKSNADRAERIAQENIALDYFIHEVHKRELADADPGPHNES